jgi:hypothetical protein
MIDTNKTKARVSDIVQQGTIAFAASITTGAAIFAVGKDGVATTMIVMVLSIVFGFLAAVSRGVA